MIEKAKITFQGHIDKLIKFTPGFNVITGDTDSGKSSIFRALNFTLRNITKRINYVPHDLDSADSTVWINGHKVRRIKGKGNTYQLDDGKELKAFGTGVPAQVEQVVNMDDINVQPQHDQLFLITESGGNIAKYLNSLIDMSVIDRTLYNLGRAQASADSSIKSSKKQLEEVEEKIQSYDFLDDAESALKGIEVLDQGIRQIRSETGLVQAILAQIHKAESAIYPDLSKAVKAFKALDKLNEDIKQCRTDYDTVDSSMIKLYLDNIDIDSGKKICSEFNNLKELKLKVGSIKLILEELTDIHSEIKSAKTRADVIKSELDEISYICNKCGSRVVK